MKIIIDAMSGDNAPLEIIKGAVLAAEKQDADIILTGDRAKINSLCALNSIDLGTRVKVADADGIIDMHDDPMSILKSKKSSSMGIGLELLKNGEGDAFISAGNTGALVVGSTLILRRIKGIKAAAIGSVLPLTRPTMLIDSGANVVVTPETLVQFALMGSVYMKKLYGLESPAVALANNGAEDTKGTPLQIEAYKQLSAVEDLNFIGNIEGRDIPFGRCDVIVADGFTGNMILKLSEGFGLFMGKTLKDIFKKNIRTKLSALLVHGEIGGIKAQLDYKKYGGAPLLGVSAPVIKAHGSSNAEAINSAVAQAIGFAKTGIVGEITSLAAKLREAKAEK